MGSAKQHWGHASGFVQDSSIRRHSLRKDLEMYSLGGKKGRCGGMVFRPPEKHRPNKSAPATVCPVWNHRYVLEKWGLGVGHEEGMIDPETFVASIIMTISSPYRTVNCVSKRLQRKGKALWKNVDQTHKALVESLAPREKQKRI